MSVEQPLDPCACTMLWFMCKRCNGSGVEPAPPGCHGDYCLGCDGIGQDFADLSYLFVNWREALIAERAWQLGREYGFEDYPLHSWQTNQCWRPGRGWDAP